VELFVFGFFYVCWEGKVLLYIYTLLLFIEKKGIFAVVLWIQGKLFVITNPFSGGGGLRPRAVQADSGAGARQEEALALLAQSVVALPDTHFVVTRAHVAVCREAQAVLRAGDADGLTNRSTHVVCARSQQIKSAAWAFVKWALVV
jgi:hypothetical protein